MTMPSTSSLAVIVTMPGRSIAQTVESLRPQVDRLHVFFNGYKSVPASASLADEWRVDRMNRRGSAGKLAWVGQWDGLYFGCDDDLAYPPDYVDTMREAVEEWQTLVTCHGRILRSSDFHDASFTAHALRDVAGRWINYPGGCAMAFHTDLGVPEIKTKNCEEPELAVWAQEHQIPIRLQPHTAEWLEYLLPLEEPNTIWNEEVRTGFVRRNAPLKRYRGEWTVHEPVTV